ncbi:hypothetical protein Tco_1405853 [Tanacetum coccineum]
MRTPIRRFGMAIRVGIFAFVDLIVLLLYLTISFYYISEMDLFAFVRYSDPTKVVVGERNVVDGEAKLLVSTEGRTVPLVPPALAASENCGDSIDKLFDEGNDAEQGCSTEKGDDVLEETIAKDVPEIAVEKTKNKRKSKAVGDASGSTHPPKRLREDFYAATSDIGGKSLASIRGLILEDSSVSELNLQTRPLVTRSSITDVPVVTVVATTTIAADVSSITNDSMLDDPYVCRDLTDCLALPAFFSQLQKEAKIAHLRSLLSLKESEAAEAIRLCEQVSVVEAADVVKGDELRDLKEKNFALEEEKDILSERVMTLESVTTLKETKVVSLESERGGLVNQISLLESALEIFKQQMEAIQDEQATVLCNRVMELDAQLLEMVAHLEGEFYPCFLVTISGRRWILTHGLKLVLLNCLQSLEYYRTSGQAISCAIHKGIQDGLKAGVDHGKAGRDLSVIEAYDPFTESKYIDVVNALGVVDFSLLTELESKKDASMVDLEDSLHFEGPLAEIPKAKDLQPSPKQLILPIHRTEDNEKCLSLTDVMVPLVEPLSSKSLIGEASTSAAPATARPITTLSMTFVPSGVVPPLFIPDYRVLDPKPHDGDPSSIT